MPAGLGRQLVDGGSLGDSDVVEHAQGTNDEPAEHEALHGHVGEGSQ